VTSRRVVETCSLVRQTPSSAIPVRGVRPCDEQGLAVLLYAAYRGTIDDEGETFSDALAEIGKTLAGDYGDFLPECSFLIEEGEFIASAVLISWWEPHQAPLVVFTMTRPEHRRKGYARTLIQGSMNALIDRGYNRLTLVVTEGNTPAQRLYDRLGFKPITDRNTA